MLDGHMRLIRWVWRICRLRVRLWPHAAYPNVVRYGLGGKSGVHQSKQAGQDTIVITQKLLVDAFVAHVVSFTTWHWMCFKHASSIIHTSLDHIHNTL